MILDPPQARVADSPADASDCKSQRGNLYPELAGGSSISKGMYVQSYSLVV